MGWYGRIDPRPVAKVVTEELERENRYKVVGRSGKYYAVRNLDTGTVFGLVVLSRRENRVWLYTKLVTEDMGPAESSCPESVLRLLSPAEIVGGYAAEWRQRCREHNATKAAAGAVKLSPGMVVELVEPITFANGETVTRMTFRGGFRFRSERGTGLVLPKNWRTTYQWRIVETVTA